MSNRGKALLLSLILAACCLPLVAQSYSLQSFSYPYVPKADTCATGINNRGAVVGWIFHRSRHLHGYGTRGFKRDANGVFEAPIDNPNANSVYYAIPNGINDSGTISGYYFSESRNSYSGFLVNNGVFTDYFRQPGPITEIYGINNKGDFVGIDGHGYRAFVSANGVVTHFTYPGANVTLPLGIGADGTIVGFFGKNHRDWGFIRGPAGQYELLAIPGARDTRAYGVNNASHTIVGRYSTSGGYHGFVYDYTTGVITTVDWPDPNATGTMITGINSHGVIVGCVFSHDAQGHTLPTFSFIGTPQ